MNAPIAISAVNMGIRTISFVVNNLLSLLIVNLFYLYVYNVISHPPYRVNLWYHLFMLTTKDHVIASLIKASDYISGESISTSLGISRAAVNTAVKALRAEGYSIESSTKKGYRLESAPGKLSLGELLPYLPESRLSSVIVEDSVTSTNDVLKNLASSGAPEGTVLIADRQTKGKGRRGRSFESPSGTGIYFSYLLRPAASPASVAHVTACTAVCVHNAILNACGIETSIKWVNDLVLDSRKICGILTEMNLESESYSIDSIIVGIGINVNGSSDIFPPEVRSVAGSIESVTGTHCDRARIASALITEMDRLASCLTSDTSSYLETYSSSCITLGKEVSVVSVHDSGETPRHGTAIAVNPDYTLKVRFTDGTVTDIQSGEVSVRGLYGYI